MNTEIRNSELAQQVGNQIKSKYESGKLKDKHIKDFLKKYYDGDPTNTCPVGCKADCQLECYIEIHQSLIDDKGNLNEFEVPYTRDKQNYCCGKEMETLQNGNIYCTVCGNEYNE